MFKMTNICPPSRARVAHSAEVDWKHNSIISKPRHNFQIRNKIEIFALLLLRRQRPRGHFRLGKSGGTGAVPVGWLASRGATSQFNHREEFVFDISSIRYQLGSLPGWDRAAGSHPRLGGPVSSPLSYTSKKCENVAGQDWSSHHTSHSYCLSCKNETLSPLARLVLVTIPYGWD